MMRICSLLPAATEILFALGLGEQVVGVTHECDFPPEAASRAQLIRPRIDATASPGEIERQVRGRTERGESIYEVDGERLRALAPDLVVTQELCRVCAASTGDLAEALARLDNPPRVFSFSPQRLSDVWRGIRELGEATGRGEAAEELVTSLESRVHAVAARMSGAPRPSVLCLEWLDPPYIGGHWVPEMVELAGGTPLRTRAGVHAVALDWKEVIESRPEVIVLMPCGNNLERTIEEYRRASLPAGWWDLPAVRIGRVSAVDANSYFSRCGPRLAAGVEILAHAIHPDLAVAPIRPGALAPAERARGRAKD